MLEWQWIPFAGADGYGTYLASADLAGPYQLQVRQAATAGTGSQKFSRAVPGAAPGDSFYGVVTAVTGGATAESGFSNADATTFLPAQAAVSPAPGALVGSGRPAFTWGATEGAVGYLYYIFDKNPWASDATMLWSNYPQSTAQLSASYPAEREALPSGTYWWWVAGVSFDSAGKADAFTFSEPRSFIVP